MEATKPFLISFAKVSIFETCKVFAIFLHFIKLILKLDTFIFIYTLLYEITHRNLHFLIS